MRDTFGIDYKSSELKAHFQNFKMKFEGQQYKDPLQFLNELAQLRHRIVHASNIMQGTTIIVIRGQVLYKFHTFYALLTEYIDDLFAQKFDFERELIDPAKA